MNEQKCAIPKCEEVRIHPEVPFCHDHAVSTIIATVQASGRSEGPNAEPEAR